MEATQARLARALGLASKDVISTRVAAAKSAGVIRCVNDNAHRSVPRRYRVLVSSSVLVANGVVPVFPAPDEVRRMMDDPAAYERAKAAYLAEEWREGGAEAAAEG